MHLTLSLLTLLPTLCSTHPSPAKNTLHQLSPASFGTNHKRNAESADAAPESDANIPTSMTPWDDAGRSQVLDNEPSVQQWRQCPQFSLNCKKCPSDARCRKSPRPIFPWWRPADVLDVPDVLSGPVIAGEDGVVDGADEEVEKECRLQSCQEGDCGNGAKCVRGHCVCDLGFKGEEGSGAVVRGFDGLQALTVWVDRGMACDVPCESLSCAEVGQVDACFVGVGGIEGEDEDHEMVATSHAVGSGAVNLPGAVIDCGEAADYVGGIADSGVMGKEN